MFRTLGLALALSLVVAPAYGDEKKKEDDAKVVVTKDGKKRKVLTFDVPEEVDGEEHKPSVEFIEGRPDLTDGSIDLTIPEKVGGETVERQVSKSQAKKKTNGKK